MQTQKSPSAVHWVIEQGKPRFQLRRGEVGLAVYDADALRAEEILPNFRPGSMLTTQQSRFIESFGLRIEKTVGELGLPRRLQENHWEIRPGEAMTRNQFKAALKMLDAAAQE